MLGYRQQRIERKLSSLRIREYILKENNFTIGEYLGYRAVWDSLVKEINSLCRVKDVDEVVVERWWERVVYRHTINNFTNSINATNPTDNNNTTPSKRPKRTNKQIY